MSTGFNVSAFDVYLMVEHMDEPLRCRIKKDNTKICNQTKKKWKTRRGRRT